MNTPERHAFEFVPAPEALGPYLNSLYVLRIERSLSEMLPAYSGQLLLVQGGKGRIDFGSGPVEAPEHGFVIGPLSSARRFEIEGPMLALGASFNFHGWAALTRLPVAKHGDRFVQLSTAFGPEVADRLLSLSRSIQPDARSFEEPLAQLGDIMQQHLQPLAAGHAQVIEATYAWLSSGFNPETSDLSASLPLSERQIQRLVKRFFGLSPSRLKRRYRAIRAATLLADTNLDFAKRQEVLDAFYDQAHMIREIREFTGRTPRILAANADGIMADTLGKQGYGVAGLFAGEQDNQLAKGKSRK